MKKQTKKAAPDVGKAKIEKFEEIIKIGPAFDERHKGNGIGCCRMFLVLKGNHGCVTLALSTAWYLPCTTEWKEMWVQKDGLSGWEPKADAVSYCSPVPLDDDQEGRGNCDWLGCTCYGEISWTMAEEPFSLLLNKGSDAVFDWLKNYYHTIFHEKSKSKI